MIRFADYTSEQQLKELWKEAFSDPDKYIDLYFKHKYKPYKTLVDIEDNTVLSMLQMIDYDFTYFGQDVKTSYISGAATQKSQRGNGLMRKLLHKSFEIMYNNQKLFSTLIPGEHWLYGFYEKFGYAKCFYLEKQIINYKNIKSYQDFKIKEYKNVGTNIATSYYINYFKNFDFTVKKTIDDLKTVIEDHILAGGKIFFAFHKDKLLGLCFAIKNISDNNLILKEILFEGETVRAALIEYSLEFFGCEKAILFQKAPGCKFISELIENGMIRVINAYEVLKIFAKNNQDIDVVLNVFDDVLNVNTGTYIIKDGICKKNKNLNLDNNDIVNIEQLTEFVFGYQRDQQRRYLYANLMLN